MEPSVQSKAKIALGRADKSVSWTISAAYRFAKDMIRRVHQEDAAFYTTGESMFTDGLIIVALLLAFILVYLIGYCTGSRCGRRIATTAPKAVFCNGGHQFTANRNELVTAGGERVTGNDDQQVSGGNVQPVAGGGGEQSTANVKQQSTDDGGDSTV